VRATRCVGLIAVSFPENVDSGRTVAALSPRLRAARDEILAQGVDEGD
jgi:hypothetical protein